MTDKPETRRSPFRLAFRAEGEFVNCYLAQQGTMEGAVMLGAVRRAALEKTNGGSQAYQALMRQIMGQAFLAIAGHAIAGWTVTPAPESERETPPTKGPGH
jgi:hypothetical protein